MSLTVDIKKNLGGFRLEAAFEASGVSGLLGASGSGKSLTLKCIAGIETPDSGHIELDGVTLFDRKRRIDLPPQKRRVGYLFQSYALFPGMTVRQNILCGLHAEKDPREKERALAQAMQMTGLCGLEQRRPAGLSGGEQQRAALARILVSRPRLLLLDEPFSALDGHLRERLQIETKSILAHFQTPALLVTHEREEAYRLCERIALMEHGRAFAARPAAELFADPGSVRAAELTGCKNIAAAVKTGAHELFVPDWGVRLCTALPLRDGLCAAGVHAHAFCADEPQNRFAVQPGEAVEGPFEMTVPFRFAGQDGPALWWRAPKGADPRPAALGVPPECVLPLYGD